MKLELGFHRVTEGRDQGEFQDSKISVWALPYDSQK